MRILRRRQLTRLVISFGVGVLLGKITTTAPSSSGPQDNRQFVERQVTAVDDWRTPRRSFVAQHSTSFSVLQPTSIAMQGSLGGTLASRHFNNADVTGSVAEGPTGNAAAGRSAPWPVSNRQFKGDRLVIGEAALGKGVRVAELPSTSDAISPRSVNRATSSTPRTISPPEEVHQAVAKTRLALAVAPQPEDLDQGAIKGQPAVDLVPPIIIGHSYDDRHGGDVEAFAAKYANIKESGRKVEIDGPCVSACTIVASLPKSQVCVTDRAALGVHLASDDDDRVDLAYTDWAVKKYYPKALQDWITKHGGLQEEPKFVSGSDLLKIFDACKKRA